MPSLGKEPTNLSADFLEEIVAARTEAAKAAQPGPQHAQGDQTGQHTEGGVPGEPDGAVPAVPVEQQKMEARLQKLPGRILKQINADVQSVLVLERMKLDAKQQFLSLCVTGAAENKHHGYLDPITGRKDATDGDEQTYQKEFEASSQDYTENSRAIQARIDKFRKRIKALDGVFKLCKGEDPSGDIAIVNKMCALVNITQHSPEELVPFVPPVESSACAGLRSGFGMFSRQEQEAGRSSTTITSANPGGPGGPGGD